MYNLKDPLKDIEHGARYLPSFIWKNNGLYGIGRINEVTYEASVHVRDPSIDVTGVEKLNEMLNGLIHIIIAKDVKTWPLKMTGNVKKVTAQQAFLAGH